VTADQDPSVHATPEDYGWLHDSLASQIGVCVAWARNKPLEEVLRTIVREPQTPIGIAADTWQWADQLDPAGRYGTVVEATQRDDWVLAVELNGYQATEVVESLSVGDAALALFVNVNADMSFAWAVNGVTVRAFDPLLFGPEQRTLGDPLPEELDLSFGEPSTALATAFALAERLTGHRIWPADLKPSTDRLAVGLHPG
jgi:hypothetical protein